jgi:hypothetical protein
MENSVDTNVAGSYPSPKIIEEPMIAIHIAVEEGFPSSV